MPRGRTNCILAFLCMRQTGSYKKIVSETSDMTGDKNEKEQTRNYSGH
jgi:hypothetical protein